MDQDFHIPDIKPLINFKDLFFSILSKWYLYVICVLLSLFVAYRVNLKKQSVYRLANKIVVSKEKSPLFSSTTSLTFNWGGVSDQVQTTITILKSRTHAEKVVDYLQFYVKYQKEAPYWTYDAYKKVPFIAKLDTSSFQLLNTKITIQPLDDKRYELSYKLPKEVSVQHYGSKKRKIISTSEQVTKKEFKYGEQVDLPYLNFKLLKLDEEPLLNLDHFTLVFSDFNSVVRSYKSISVTGEGRGGSSPIINLKLQGTNKNRLVDYLNASVAVLSNDQLDKKNLFAIKTIAFVDKVLDSLKTKVAKEEVNLNDFMRSTKSLNIEEEGTKLSGELSTFDVEKTGIKNKLSYLEELKRYLLRKTEFADITSPTVVGIDEQNITSNVGKIVELSIQRSNLKYSMKESAPIFKDLDRNINALKSVLLENISSYKNALFLDLKSVQGQLNKKEAKLSKLPENQQKLVNIQRKYNLNSELYDLFLQKKSEAALIKAANVSDLSVIDAAKDVGDGLIGPNKKVNYFIAIGAGLALPTLIILLLFLLNNKINGPQDVEFLSKIPVLGVVGKSTKSLAVFERSNSPVAESFRAMRSSLEFIYKREKIKSRAKTILVTSSVSGEGKTFTSINMASIYATSGKKTVLVGLDLRKPKIFDDFNLTNDFGVVNYLIEDKTFEEVVQQTQIPNLDLILSGPIPPNPSELLISDKMEEFIALLKEEYDYVILDTPPLGLVTDALDIMKYADAKLYMIRQNYTLKNMLGLINEKYKNKEIKNVSFVLNYFKAKKGYAYGYGYGYGVYGNGYHQDDKPTSLWQRVSNKIKKS